MIDSNHPRATSLKIRDKIIQGVEIGITSKHGLIAQGRGEAFDYLLGEQTHIFATEAIEAAASALLLAEYPVLSTNGNSTALCPEEFVKLSSILQCPIEVNLFHRTYEREKAIQVYLEKYGAKNIVGIGTDASEEIKEIASKRKFVSSSGIQKADVVFVPLEDGDRTEALVKVGKKIITIDLNPLSRTAQKATITIVDNIVRAMPLLIEEIQKLQAKRKEEVEKILREYENKEILKKAMNCINNNLQKQR